HRTARKRCRFTTPSLLSKATQAGPGAKGALPSAMPKAWLLRRSAARAGELVESWRLQSRVLSVERLRHRIVNFIDNSPDRSLVFERLFRVARLAHDVDGFQQPIAGLQHQVIHFFCDSFIRNHGQPASSMQLRTHLKNPAP